MCDYMGRAVLLVGRVREGSVPLAVDLLVTYEVTGTETGRPLYPGTDVLE